MQATVDVLYMAPLDADLWFTCSSVYVCNGAFHYPFGEEGRKEEPPLYSLLRRSMTPESTISSHGC